ncbi:CYTH domain-containing protein [Mangrovibacterium lignilyticum]|uniref:CYTH domain-containing protein n=1 Tax=Mangrovibacterium lignilyticum TaxID=2668052 RepID=UPI0013D3FEC1|nr:CYTH domain-containing protein [Mangrovibacterium lignilyticum]
MAVEIERKFLVREAFRPQGEKQIHMIQGYLCADPDRTVRIRVADEKAYLTVKGGLSGISRPEFEYEIPVPDAREMLSLAVYPVIDKVRHIIYAFDKKWEVDVFEGANSGLIIAEIELSHANETVQLPDWIGEEVTGDLRYHNSRLAENPYETWKD